MRDNQDRNHDDRDDHLAENQRIGKRIAQENRNQNPQDEYRSGRDYHNQPQPGNQSRQHYGADPNSAYRNSNINYGDGRNHREDDRGNQFKHNQNNYNQGQNQNQNSWPRDRGMEQWNRDNRHPQDGHYRAGENYLNNRNNNQDYNNQNNRNYNQGYNNQNNRHEDENRFNQSDNQFYHGQEPRMFDDRKHFEAEDYRYGSGRRQWESPGYDDNDNHNDNRQRGQQERGFFGRLADEIRDDWRTFTHPEEYRTEDQNQNRSDSRNPDTRNFNRGYESGPRWADEDNSRRQGNDRRRNRDHDNDHNRY